MDEVSLRDFIEAQLIDHYRTHDMEEREREQLRTTMERRLDGMNEFRDALKDQRGIMVSRETFDSLAGRVTNLERLIPLVSLLSVGVGAALVAAITKLVGG